MKKRNSFLFSIAIAVIVFSLNACSLTDDGVPISVTLPEIGNTSRAIVLGDLPRLKNETSSYRVTMNDTVLTGTGGTYIHYFPIGSVVNVTVECLNSRGEVILQTVTKNITVESDNNTISFNLSQDGIVLKKVFYVNKYGDDINGNGSYDHPFRTIKKAIDFAETLYGGDEKTIELQSDIALDSTIAISSGKIVITSAGINKITRASSSFTSEMLNVSGGNVTLRNIKFDGGKNESFTGTTALIRVTGASAVLAMENGTYVVNNNNTGNSGSGVRVENGAFYMRGGEISGNAVTKNGGGVCVNDGVFEMSGSAVIKNNSSGQNGGGVTSFATFNMKGGQITDNISTQSGAGVYISQDTNSVFTMSGNAAIRNNTATNHAGGVYVDDRFIMTGGEISDNKAVGTNSNQGAGGGIYISATGVTTINGNSVIKNNTSANNGGGIAVNGNLKIGSGVKIISNSKNDQGHNVYIATDKIITVLEKLDSTNTSIGISMQSAGVFTSGWNAAWTTHPFTSDDSAYQIGFSSGELELK